MKIDLHVHTESSIDSIIKIDDLAKKSKSLGIIPAITDHNNIRSHERFRKLGTPFIPGEEIRTDRGDLIALFINENIPKGTGFAESLDMIKVQGALSYLPHMYDLTRAGAIPEKGEINKIDIIETFNARTLDKNMNLKAMDFAKKHSLLQGVGSDSHFLFEFGSTYNIMPDFDLGDPKDFLRSMAKSSYQKTSAPFYVRGTTTMVKFMRRINGSG